MRLCAYNVQGFRASPKTVAAAIAEERPDVVFVNEAGSRRSLGQFASALGMSAASGLRWFGGLPNGLAVRGPWRVAESRVLAFTRAGRLIPRGAFIAELAGAGGRLTAVAVHLGLSDREREGHVRELTDALAALPSPVAIGGDLNEGPDGAAAAWMAGRYWDAFAGAGEGPGLTFSAREPRARIDYLFLGEGLTAERAWVLDSPQTRSASDHLPVFATVRTASE
ncbi:MAG: endonuclease/exonuclease/phosphatase family protein [Actinobacteria bacterium]|nr:endonuclease/exonuclease/phosphatase family protein [Actinomycetota bacterium]